MTTKQQLITQAKKDNPKPLFRVENDVQIELTDAEYEESIEKWAEMRLEQLAIEQADADEAVARESALSKLSALGLTDDEVRALLG
jgi:hypothetical protein